MCQRWCCFRALQALTRLTRLGLEGNRLAALPAWLDMPLQEIYLDNNYFDCCLPEALTACTR